MESIITSCKELVKVWAYKNVDFGDKQIDSIMSTIIFITIGIMLDYLFNFHSEQIYSMLTRKPIFHVELSKKLKAENALQNATRQIIYGKDIEFEGKLLKFLRNQFLHLSTFDLKAIFQSLKDYKFNAMLYGTDLLEIAFENGSCPTISFRCGYYSTIAYFIQYIETLETIIPEKKEVCKYPCIYIGKMSDSMVDIGSSISTVFPDRNFNRIASKHKKDILSYVNNFKNYQENGISKFNSMTSHNLGIMISGRPGTGKTTFIKAICNELQRDALIVNMRDLKNRKQFESLFRAKDIVNKMIYVFDEFDCVQGIIKNRSFVSKEDEKMYESTDNVKKKELNDQLINLLAMQSAATDKDTFRVEIQNVKQEIQNLQQAINLDTMLEVFDGIAESRGRVMIACTNYPDRIDPALLRPGRFDIKIKLESLDDTEIRNFLAILCESEALTPKQYDLIKATKYPKGMTPAILVNMASVSKDFEDLFARILSFKSETDINSQSETNLKND